MITIHIAAVGVPKPKGSMKHVGRGRMVEQVKGSKEWRQMVALAARSARKGAAPLAGPIVVVHEFVVPRPKTVKAEYPITRSSGDLDKLIRNIFDGLTDAGVWGDDSQVVSSQETKRFAVPGEEPGVVVTVRPL